jgi:hypothetical protein
MSYFGKILTRGFLSENSDYSTPSYDTRTDEYNLVVTRVAEGRQTVTDTAVGYIDTTPFTTATGIVLINHGTVATQFVTAVWQSLIYTRSAGNLIFHAATATITDAACTSWNVRGVYSGNTVVVSTSEGGTNDGSSTITSTSATNLVCAAATFVDNLDDDTAILKIYGQNGQVIAPLGGQLVLTGNIFPAADIAVTSQSGSPELEYIILGT